MNKPGFDISDRIAKKNDIYIYYILSQNKKFFVNARTRMKEKELF